MSLSTKFKDLICSILFFTGMIAFFNLLLNKIHRGNKKKNETEKKKKLSYVIREKFQKGVPILRFHRINDNNDPFLSAFSTKMFEKHIKYLKRKYTILPLENIINEFAQGKPLHNAVAITFDDGYRDNFLYAYPVLKKYAVPATIFLTSGLINTGEILWMDKIRYVLKKTKKKALQMIDIFHGKIYPLNTIDEKIEALNGLYMDLIKCDERDKLHYINSIIEPLGVQNFDELADLMLTWEQVKIMGNNGVSFGAHTVSHPILSRIPIHQARQEILKSKEDIEKNVEKPVSSFAYPNGKEADFNEDICDLVKESGCTFACTTIMGTINQHTDPYLLPRISLEKPLPVFATRLEWYMYFS
jgi:peptidoglycan/xylan/chitin deacetylase (PgdA/CDA1 family)